MLNQINFNINTTLRVKKNFKNNNIQIFMYLEYISILHSSNEITDSVMNFCQRNEYSNVHSAPTVKTEFHKESFQVPH